MARRFCLSILSFRAENTTIRCLGTPVGVARQERLLDSAIRAALRRSDLLRRFGQHRGRLALEPTLDLPAGAGHPVDDLGEQSVL